MSKFLSGEGLETILTYIKVYNDKKDVGINNITASVGGDTDEKTLNAYDFITFKNLDGTTSKTFISYHTTLEGHYSPTTNLNDASNKKIEILDNSDADIMTNTETIHYVSGIITDKKGHTIGVEDGKFKIEILKGGSYTNGKGDYLTATSAYNMWLTAVNNYADQDITGIKKFENISPLNTDTSTIGSSSNPWPKAHITNAYLSNFGINNNPNGRTVFTVNGNSSAFIDLSDYVNSIKHNDISTASEFVVAISKNGHVINYTTITASQLKTALSLSQALTFRGIIEAAYNLDGSIITDTSYEHFIDNKTAKIKLSSGTFLIPQIGDVVIDKNKSAEYLCVGLNQTNNNYGIWEHLGQDSSFLLTTGGTLSGNLTITGKTDLQNDVTIGTNSKPVKVNIVANSGNVNLNNIPIVSNSPITTSKISITSSATEAPIEVNSEVKIAHLNADLLDGHHSSDFISNIQNSTTDDKEISITKGDGKSSEFTINYATNSSNIEIEKSDNTSAHYLIGTTNADGGEKQKLKVNQSSIFFNGDTLHSNIVETSSIKNENGNINITSKNLTHNNNVIYDSNNFTALNDNLIQSSFYDANFQKNDII